MRDARSPSRAPLLSVRPAAPTARVPSAGSQSSSWAKSSSKFALRHLPSLALSSYCLLVPASRRRHSSFRHNLANARANAAARSDSPRFMAAINSGLMAFRNSFSTIDKPELRLISIGRSCKSVDGFLLAGHVSIGTDVG